MITMKVTFSAQTWVNNYLLLMAWYNNGSLTPEQFEELETEQWDALPGSMTESSQALIEFALGIEVAVGFDRLEKTLGRNHMVTVAYALCDCCDIKIAEMRSVDW